MGIAHELAASPSESEESFVSAEVENTSPSKVRGDISQSAPARAPLLPSSSPRRQGHQPSKSATSSSPSRNGNENGRVQQGAESSPLSHDLPTPLSPPVGSYFAAQPSSTPGIEPRSPLQRRPPASRSSHGIETHSGPPPALSTQRSYNAESPWRSAPLNDSGTTPKPLPQRQRADDSIALVLQASRSSTHDRRNSEPSKITNGTRPLSSVVKLPTVSMTYQNGAQVSGVDEDPTLRMNGQRMTYRRQSGHGRDGWPKDALHEDLFLDLAREDSVTDDASEVMSRSERRRSRLGIQPKSSSPPSSSGRPRTSGAQFPLDDPKTERLTPKSCKVQMPSFHPLEKASFSSPVQGYSPESQRVIGRRRSIQATSPALATRSYKSSNPLHLSKHSRYASPPFLEKSQPGEGTESTVSTTPASTVWDELDDMKSRIRQLELTGKLPLSSNAAISSALGDRPATAGTTMTTMSSSPKRRQRQSMPLETSTIRAPEIAEVHPLLHSALARSKDTVDPNVYQILEAISADALALAAITGGAGVQDSGVERQLRRKADSMCRSLTELCIALAEEKFESLSPGLRPLPASRNGTPPTHRTELTQESRFLRGVSEDPELRASSRVMSRLESRRTSLRGSASGHSPREQSQEPATPTQSTTTLVSKLDRTNSVLRRRDNDDESKTRRPPSRATTETGQMRPSPQTRVSREYISSHPLPSFPKRSPSVQSSLPTRKSYFTNAPNSPITPSNTLSSNRRYLQGSTPPSSADSARLAEARQRRLASLGQPNSASQPRVGRLRQTESEE